ncbi:MAG: protein kinase [Thermoguttaceae bacterium]
MSDTTSSSRTSQPLPGPLPEAAAPPGAGHSGPLHAEDAPNLDAPSRDAPSPPLSDEQPTIISNRPPVAPASISDSANRIVQGKILPGDRLGHFEVLEYVGGGGMGRVFRAFDRQLSRQVALKVLLPEQTADDDAQLRFKNEAQSAARLDHANIARVYHVGEDRGLNYIVFEFVEGINIRRLVQDKGPLTIAESVSYTLQVAEALAHAAGREVVHRDVKPSNVLVTSEGHVKLIDMGLARLKRVDAEAADLTATGVTLGTFDYISPEQARDPRSADVRSDIYSLGCTFFYMLAGRPPFPEGTVLQKLLQHQGDQPPDVREFRPELPEDVTRVLLKMLAKDPRHRYRDPSELLADLMLLAEQVGLRPIGPDGKVLVPPQVAPVSFLQHHLPWIAPIVALIGIVVLLDSFWSVPALNLPPVGPTTVDGTPIDPQNPTVAMEPSGNPRPSHDASSEPIAATPPNESPPSPGDVPDVSPEAVSPGPNVIGVAPPDERVGPAEPVAVEDPQEPSVFDPLAPLVTAHVEGGLTFDPFGFGMSIGDTTPPALSVVPSDVSASSLLTVATNAATSGTAATDRAKVLIVREIIENEGEFTSISAACSAASNNDIIELRYNGRREERPMKTNLRFTIRAGEGYRPVIVFRPDEIDPVIYPRSMFTVAAGQLTLCNLALELHVPREVSADHWSLFETQGSPTVRLQQCTLTIANASDQFDSFHEDVAFFRVTAAPFAGMGMEDMMAAPATIDLSDCVVRGEAMFLRVKDLQPTHLTWENGLLVTTERLLFVDGGKEPPRQSIDRIQVDLRHVTAVVRDGFCRLQESWLQQYQGTTRIDCSNSIILAASADALLIEQVGFDSVQAFYLQVAWVGDCNFYEGIDSFWTIWDLSKAPLIEPKTFEDWKLHWSSENENLPRYNQVDWQESSPTDKPFHTRTPDDYALDDTGDNPAIGSAPDGSNAGLRIGRLPLMPTADGAEIPTGRNTGSVENPG